MAQGAVARAAATQRDDHVRRLRGAASAQKQGGVLERTDRTRAGEGSPIGPGMAASDASICNEQRSGGQPGWLEGAGAPTTAIPAPETGTVVPLWHRTGVSTATTSQELLRKYAWNGSGASPGARFSGGAKLRP